MFLLKANKVNLAVRQRETITSGSRNIYLCKFEFSDEWDGVNKTAVFRAGDTEISTIIEEDMQCQIPHEVLETYGVDLYVGVYGSKNDELTMPTIWARLAPILKGTNATEFTSPPSPSVYDQILSYAKSAEEIARSVRDDADGGKFNGAKGDPGLPPKVGSDGYWYVHDIDKDEYIKTDTFAGGDAPRIGENGNWFIGAEDTGVCANGVSPDISVEKVDGGHNVEITGAFDKKIFTVADGQNGKTPEKGIDYFTDSDIKEIVSQTIQILPEPIQPDWSQNDSSASDYVKNRPGGYRIESSTELVNGDYTFTARTGRYITQEFTSNLILELGKEYVVVIDNNKYSLTAESYLGNPSMVVIGDPQTMTPCYLLTGGVFAGTFNLPNPNNETDPKVFHIEIYTDVVSEYVKFPREVIPDILPEVTSDDAGKFLRVSPDGEWGSEAVEVLNGNDGVSPTVSITEISGGHRISITDAEGTKTADILDGKQGIPGIPGTDGQNGVSATHSWNGTVLTVTSASGTSSADLKGEPGESIVGPTGKDGNDGYTPVKGVDYFDGAPGATGPAGAAGKDGHTPVKGTDYWTAADRQSMVSDVLAALPTWTGGSY